MFGQQIQGTLYGSDTIIGGAGKDVIYAKDGSHDSIQVKSDSKVYRYSADSLTLP